jgi:hypothetical protein
MIFIVGPGGTDAVRAQSLNWALLAIARMSPVEGRITTIALSSVPLTASRAACSAAGLIVEVVAEHAGLALPVGQAPDRPRDGALLFGQQRACLGGFAGHLAEVMRAVGPGPAAQRPAQCLPRCPGRPS